MGAGIDFFLDVQDCAILTNVICPTERKRSLFGYHTVGFGSFLGRIAEDRIVQSQRLGEFFVSLCRITASGEIGNVVLADGIATCTK